MTASGRCKVPLVKETARELGKAREQYDARYRAGYMDAWPLWKRDRIAQLVCDLGLPSAGVALDFGCGAGVFTAVLRASLPAAWSVEGTDISEVALARARERVANAQFFCLGDERAERRLTGRCDLVFTHHVLEHVTDLEATIEHTVRVTKPGGIIFHVLPCGNAGSFEHGMAEQRPDGIERNRGERFFFEEEGHLRRLTSSKLSSLYESRGYTLTRQHYANQYWGALQWISETGPRFIWRLTDTRGLPPKQFLQSWRRRAMLLGLWGLRYPARAVRWASTAQASSTNQTLARLVTPVLPLSRLIDRWTQAKSGAEWSLHKTDPHASEMYLVFQKRGGDDRGNEETTNGMESLPSS